MTIELPILTLVFILVGVTVLVASFTWIAASISRAGSDADAFMRGFRAGAAARGDNVENIEDLRARRFTR